MALALYRKYRPATFSEVVGQEHVTEPLRTALAAGRINHAYLFSGPRGCGKTSSARIMARSLNCVEGPTPDPCGVCNSCVALAPEGPGSLDVVELDAASHGGVDDTRDLRDRAFYMPAESRYRVFIIDEAHMVSTQGFNALLKIVEEPPEHLVFIFATTEPDKVMTTIRSRTHHYPFRLIPPATLRKLLEKLCHEEDVTVEAAVFPLVIRAGGGSARDSLSILDQLLAGAGPGGVTYASAVALLGVTDSALLDEMVDAFAAGDGASVFGAVDKVVEAGHDPRRFAADLLQRLRDLVIIAAVPDAGEKGLIDAPADQIVAMYGQSERLGASTLTRLADVLHTGLVDMRGTTSPRLVLELMCARMLLPATATGEGAMLQRIERLERSLASGVVPAGLALGAGEQAPPGAVDSGSGTGVGSEESRSTSSGNVDGAAGRSKPAYRRPSLRSESGRGSVADTTAVVPTAVVPTAVVPTAVVPTAVVPTAVVPTASHTEPQAAVEVVSSDSAASAVTESGGEERVTAGPDDLPSLLSPNLDPPGGAAGARPEPAPVPAQSAPDASQRPTQSPAVRALGLPARPVLSSSAKTPAAPAVLEDPGALSPVSSLAATLAPQPAPTPAPAVPPASTSARGLASPLPPLATTASSGAEEWPAPPEPPLDEEYDDIPVDPGSASRTRIAPGVSSPPVAATPQAPALRPSPEPDVLIKVSAAGEPAAHSSPGARAADALGVTDVRRLWKEILAAVQKRRRTTQILLEGTTVIDVKNRVLYLTMPSPGMARRVVESANAELLREALREVMNVDWTIRCDAAGDAPPSRPATSSMSNQTESAARAEEDDTPDDYDASRPDPAGRSAPRDPEEVAIELLTQHLGATPIAE
ncbi:DNA polymerase III subunit gamma and tau [Nakamurella antarctica]|uniref:DNA polymerase III subunit gamma/tau n=1 Tax=Nakamurella antarctica TaxID=1902245 RepID=A0A3G8ZI79_9ACTN|nr:DNA polymerase III subunit gamma and tau [Nakamurella antarctica]AZI57112.1 DNA polymerase III subunit gamma and tau [Nakamurella antarctica]